MSSAITTRAAAPLIEFDQEKTNLIKKTFGDGLTDGEFELYLATAKARGLDPLMNQIHAVKRRDGDTKKMVLQVGIDGYRLVAARTGSYAGKDETIFEYDKNSKLPRRAIVTVYKIVQGHRVGFTESAAWAEYYPGDKQGFMWKKMPETMIGKCAEAKALRSAFPADLAGLYVPEEFEKDRSNDAPTEKLVEARKRFEETAPKKDDTKALPGISEGEGFVAVKIDFKDVENRARLKGMGFKWSASLKAWVCKESQVDAEGLGLEYEIIAEPEESNG